MLYTKTEIVLANFADLAAAWENVGEVKSAVSEIWSRMSGSIVTGGLLGDRSWTSFRSAFLKN